MVDAEEPYDSYSILIWNKKSNSPSLATSPEGRPSSTGSEHLPSPTSTFKTTLIQAFSSSFFALNYNHPPTWSLDNPSLDMSDQPLPAPSTQTLPGAKEYGVSDCCLKGNQYVLLSSSHHHLVWESISLSMAADWSHWYRRFEGEPKGKMVKLGGFDVYVAAPVAPKEGKESRGIVLFSDIFGLGIKNPKVCLLNERNQGRRAFRGQS